MSFEDRESLDTADPQSLFFGSHDHDRSRPHGPVTQTRRSRRDPAERERRRRRRKHRFVTLLAFIVVLGVLAGGWFVVKPMITKQFAVADWSGSGTGQVTVTVHPGDDASTIAATLVDAGVVRSVKAFTNAAAANNASQNLQPGAYRLHKHMSGKLALTLMLNPSSLLLNRLTIPEGLTEKDILAKVAASLHVPLAQVQAAADNVGALGVPSAYQTNGRWPVSAEGFLFPSTYDFDPGTSPADALQQMTTQFATVDRSAQFASGAPAVHVSPYQALIVASMIESEAKFPADRAKVARVVYNRLARNMPLGIDATSVYAAKLAGTDPSKITFEEKTPYNTRIHVGLPPTPISNPGEESMQAAVNPAPGNWLYYVNGDAQGHLFFTNSPQAFEQAVEQCRTHHWGCS